MVDFFHDNELHNSRKKPFFIYKKFHTPKPRGMMSDIWHYFNQDSQKMKVFSAKYSFQ